MRVKYVTFGLLAFFVSACGGGGGSSITVSPDPVIIVPPTNTPTATPAPSNPDAVVTETNLSRNADFPIGVAVAGQGFPGDLTQDSSSRGNARRNKVAQHFSELSPENAYKMEFLQPSEGTFFYNDAEMLLAFAEANNMSFHGHVLVWYLSVPDWLNQSADQDAALRDHVENVACHFAGRLKSWDVVNEAIDDSQSSNTTFRVTPWSDAGDGAYIEDAFIAAEAAQTDPACNTSGVRADLYYNDYNTEWNIPKRNVMINMANDFIERGVPIDGLGFQMHVDIDSPRLDIVRSSFRLAVNTGLKVKITEMDVAMNTLDQLTSFPDVLAVLQKQRYEDIISIYMEEVPPEQRGGITVWGTNDGNSWLRTRDLTPLDKTDPPSPPRLEWPLLFDDNFDEKPALQGIADALQTQFIGN